MEIERWIKKKLQFYGNSATASKRLTKYFENCYFLNNVICDFTKDLMKMDNDNAEQGALCDHFCSRIYKHYFDEHNLGGPDQNRIYKPKFKRNILESWT